MTSTARTVPDLSPLVNAYRELVPTLTPFHQSLGHKLLVFPAEAGPWKTHHHKAALFHLVFDGTLSAYRVLDGLPTGKSVIVATVSAAGHAAGDHSSRHEAADGPVPS